MQTAILLLNFGEPDQATPEQVVPFLERIFLANAALMGPAEPAAVAARSRRLAEERAPGLIEEYRLIGGSPLRAQAEAQARALEAELRARGSDALVLVAMQFTDPSIPAVVARARESGAARLVALPVYPLAGPSTTAAALRELDRALAEAGWTVPVVRISGWHAHPDYLRLRAEAVRATLAAHGLDLADPETRLVFSAHGTPLRYVEQGSRYVEYVEWLCPRLAAALGAPRYELGYQNHANRPGVAWSQPEIDAVVRDTDARRVVVDAVSFLHEQSETLAELDHGLRGVAEARGVEFFRVPVPHDAAALVRLLADLVTPFTRGEDSPLRPCRCFPSPNTFCANAAAG